MYAYERQGGVEVRVARIFNTFGRRMHPNDGRVVSNFIIQALQNKDITLYGDGSQTRSFQFVDDLVDGLYKLMNSNYSQPVNLGNPDEYTVAGFAETGAAKESEIPNFKGSYLGRFPLVLADFWTSDLLSERSRSVDAFSGTRARGTLTLKRR